MSLLSGEFNQRFAGRYFGKFRGVVSDVSDPEKIGRLMIRVPVVLGGEESVGWALPSTGGGGVGTGFFSIPRIGEFVWVEFEEGDPQRAIWSYGPWGRRNNENMVPKHARGERDTVDSQLRSTGILPASSFAGEYPWVHIQKTSSGHFWEFDDTEDETRVQIAHNCGTRIEFLHDGSSEYVTSDENRHYIGADYLRETMGSEDILCHQDVSYEATTSMTLKSAGGEIILNTGGAPGISLGGNSASEPFVMGNQYMNLLTQIITYLSAHTHTTGSGPSGATIEAPAITALISQIQSTLSTYINGR